MVKNLPANAGSTGDTGSIPGGRNGNPLQYSCLRNPIDRGIWQSAVHQIQKESDKNEQLNSNMSPQGVHSPSESHLCPGNIDLRILTVETSLVVQWLILYTYTAQSMGSIPGQGTKIPTRQIKNKTSYCTALFFRHFLHNKDDWAYLK